MLRCRLPPADGGGRADPDGVLGGLLTPGNGCTRMPRPTATSTAVVNESTSTTTSAAQTRPSSAAPVSPQSNRAPEPGWP